MTDQNTNTAPKQNADDVLGTARKPPKKFSKKVVLAASCAAFLTAGSLLTYGIFHQPNQNISPADQQDSNAGAAPFDNMTPDYRPEEHTPPAAAPAANTQQAAVMPMVPRQPQQQPQAQNHEPTEEEKQQLAAFKSDLFFQQRQTQQEDRSGSSQGKAAPGQSGAGGGANGDPQAARQGKAYGDASGEGGDPNMKMAEANNSFLNSQSNTGATYATPMQRPISPYEVQAGSVIPAALNMKSNSDLPGDVIAHVTENVYDSATGRYILIPQGSKLYGKYSNLVAYGQTRSLIVWNRIILPNGNSENIGGMIGSDAEGQSGLTGDVNHHIWSLMGALAFATAMSVGPAFAQTLQDNNGGTMIYSSPAQQAGMQTQTIGQEFLSKELNRPNTVKVVAGQTLRVLINKDLVLEPYTP